MSKTAEDFKKAIEEKGIKKWTISKCSLCDYPLSFIFEEGKVFYDVGCYCTNMRGGVESRDWEELVRHYNMQKHPEFKKAMNEFWGFPDEVLLMETSDD